MRVVRAESAVGQIAILPEDVANKIAAGEVVERPASVVKELVENAIDAHATRIRVDLGDGGKALIRVVDDGAGMTPDDAWLAVQPHATSKIRTTDDLFAIETLGFRGEALPSIASVSELTLITRPHDADEGTLVMIEGGGPPQVANAGCAPGTTVTVERMFHNVPARLKFLKTTATELGRVRDLMGRFALSHPHIGLLLYHDGTELFRSDPSDDPRAKVADVFGRSALREMVEVSHETPLLLVSGWVGKPSLAKTTRSGQHVIVNGRCVRSGVVSAAMENAFGDLLPASRRPVGVLHIAMDARLVDPNVHPTKAEVRFSRESDVFRTVQTAVRDALFAAELTPVGRASAAEDAAPPPSGGCETPTTQQMSHEALTEPPAIPAPSASSADAPPTPATAQEMDAFREALRERMTPQEPVAASPQADTSEVPGPSASYRPVVHVVGQAMRSYIIAEIDASLCIVDQHAAHERVLHERCLAALNDRPMPSQGLITPLTVEVSATELSAATASEELLAQLGFITEPFGRNALLIRSAPAALKHRDPVPVVRDLIEALCGEGEFGHVRDPRERLAASMACKAAVKADDALSAAEMEALLHDLLACSNQATCPHGRPILLRMTAGTLLRQFGRA